MSWRPSAPRGRNFIVRIARWQPENHRQVWLISAPFVASGALVGGLVAALTHGGFAVGKFLFSLPFAGVLFVGRGAIQSYRLERRRDATTYSE
jgi:hypothetical protein